MKIAKIGLIAGALLCAYGLIQLNNPTVNVVVGGLLVVLCGIIYLNINH